MFDVLKTYPPLSALRPVAPSTAALRPFSPGLLGAVTGMEGV